MTINTQISVHFSPAIIKGIGAASTAEWSSAIRDWHHLGDPDKSFGRNVPNSPGVEDTWAWHVHMAPEADADIDIWDGAKKTYDRTSNRLLVYSMDKELPTRYGILLLAFLAPKGHELLTKGVNASQRREDWENIAYSHQMNGYMPPGTVSIK